ncbi:hypothetical protein ACJX0J_015898, partial [Zea mays]
MVYSSVWFQICANIILFFKSTHCNMNHIFAYLSHFCITMEKRLKLIWFYWFVYHLFMAFHIDRYNNHIHTTNHIALKVHVFHEDKLQLHYMNLHEDIAYFIWFGIIEQRKQISHVINLIEAHY